MNMKKNMIIRIIGMVALVASINACNKDLEPYDSKSDNSALATPSDLQTATFGTYSGLKTLNYSFHFFGSSEYMGDNVAMSGTSSSPLMNVLNVTHFPGMVNITEFWQQSYKSIYSANRIIETIADGESVELDQLKGENLYLRAMLHFNLVRFFGRPYPQNAETNLGVPIKDNTLTDDFPARNTVKEVYDFIIADLLNAANLMTVKKSSIFASKEVAYALLSRVYLYQEDYDNCLLYANKVIDSERYDLLDTEEYKTYFTRVPESNSETIFAYRHTIADTPGKTSLGGMYYNDPKTSATGWGEIYASLAYVKLINKFPNDIRHSFIELQLAANGDTLRRGNVPKIFINKFNWQEGVANLSSPVYIRLAEMYLNRAEANARLGNDQLAIDDVNLIRTRAGLSGTELYAVGDLKDKASIFDVVLEEKRLEFAFEGQRAFDLFRNNLPVVKAYPGFHSPDRYHQTINPTDARVIFYIPDREIVVNKNLEQNP
jgi:hypothetical protein